MSKLRVDELESLATGRTISVDNIDSGVREDLASPSGAAMVGLEHGTLEDSGIVLTPKSFGAIPDANTPEAIAANNTALQAYATYCQEKDIFQDFSGHTYFYDQTLDMTGKRIAKLRGDVEDANNTGRYNLIYLGTGSAIKCKEIYHERLGLAGTASVIDPVNRDAVAFECDESFQHRDSCIRSFGTAYLVSGGYYSNVLGGRVHRCVNLYDFTPNPLGVYNFTVFAQHTDFENGIIANTGAGPVRMGGSWEKWTRSCLTYTAGEPDYLVELIDGCYFENYPTTNIASGLTGPHATYNASTALRLYSSSISGAGFAYCSGIIEQFAIWSFDPAVTPAPVADLTMKVGARDGYKPVRFINSPAFKAMDIKLDLDNWDANMPTLSGGCELPENGAGMYTRPDGSYGQPVKNTLSLLDGWAINTGIGDVLRVYRQGDIVHMSCGLFGGSASSGRFYRLPVGLRPKFLKYVPQRANASGGVVMLKVHPDGYCYIRNADDTADVMVSTVYVSAQFALD